MVPYTSPIKARKRKEMFLRSLSDQSLVSLRDPLVVGICHRAQMSEKNFFVLPLVVLTGI